MKNITVIASIVLLLFSCKKEETAAPITNNTNSSGTPTNGSASSATVFNGILNSLKIISIGSTNTIQYTINSPSAYFSSSAMQYINPSTAIQVDSVFVNNTKLQYSSYSYTSSTFTIVYPPTTWQVYGKNGIPSFTYTNSDASPSYTGYNQYPDSVNKASDYTFNVSGLSGFNEAQIILSDGTNGTGHILTKTINAATTSVTFTQSEIGGMNTTTNGIFSVMLKKNNVRYFGGKDFNFTSECQYTKTIKLY